jgi:hypothetical protein
VGLDAAKTQSLPSPFAPPKPPVAFRPEDEPIKTSTDIPIFLPPKPPAGYRPDDEESERTSTTEAVPAPSAEPPGDSRDGSTVLKKVDDLKRTDKPGPEPAKAFQAPSRPRATSRTSPSSRRTSSRPWTTTTTRWRPSPCPSGRGAEDQHQGHRWPLRGGSRQALLRAEDEPLARAGLRRDQETAAAEQRAREREAREGKGALDGKAGPLGLDDEETTAGGEPQPNPSLETLPHDSPAVAADGKPLDPKLAGAFSRAQAKEQAERGPPMGKATGTLKPPLTRDQRIAMGVVGGGGALIFLVLLLALAGGVKDRPSAEDLERCYPYGQNGAMGPNGQRAPAVALVKFKFDQELEEPISRDFEKCLVVKYGAGRERDPRRSRAPMVMCKRWDKIWKRGNGRRHALPHRPTETNGSTSEVARDGNQEAERVDGRRSTVDGRRPGFARPPGTGLHSRLGRSRGPTPE